MVNIIMFLYPFNTHASCRYIKLPTRPCCLVPWGSSLEKETKKPMTTQGSYQQVRVILDLIAVLPG